jgi:uncharacterized protein (TIGR02646 family)
MIRLQRPLKPKVLEDKAGPETQLLWDQWNGGQPLQIKSAIYAHRTVKQALKAAQKGKCAYCETVNPRSHDVVEHYRPKSGWRQTKTDVLNKPEYFWLAYDWQNLLFACDLCNDAGHKQNLFPLSNPANRATAHNPDITQEDPLLLNPYDTDPNDHIEWQRDVPRAKNHSECGAETIRTFGIDLDQDLLDQRRDYINFMEELLTIVEGLSPKSQKRVASRGVFRQRLQDDAPYAAMIRENLTDRIMAV